MKRNHAVMQAWTGLKQLYNFMVVRPGGLDGAEFTDTYSADTAAEALCELEHQYHIVSPSMFIVTPRGKSDSKWSAKP